MKGVKFKCGLLLALFTIFGLSVAVSSDTNALKYTVQKIPLSFTYGIYAGNAGSTPASSDSFYVSIDGDVQSHFDDSSYQYVLGMKYQNETCFGHKYTSLPFRNFNSSSNLTTYNFGFLGFDPSINQLQNWSGYNPCLTIKPMQSFNRDSVADLAPLVGSPSRQELGDLLPYRFKYDGFYRTDSMREDGLFYDVKFDLANIFGINNYPDKINSLGIPFLPKTDVSNTFYNGMPITFEGEFIIDPEVYDGTFGISDSTSIKLRTFYINNGNISIPNPFTTCNWSFQTDPLADPSDSQPVYSLKYSCPYVLGSNLSSYNPSIHAVYFRLEIDFEYESSNTKFNQFIFDSSIVVSNNDYTDGGYFDDPVQGADPDSAPGSASQNLFDGEPNYNNSLADMFNFNFINPFAPLFSLFNDNSSCVNIPTLSGMIHSDETRVCPWFDSNVRNIVTPVLGLSSMMLIFGFAVRWLGSRSGNFIEDSGGIDDGNFHFQNKFKRGKS